MSILEIERLEKRFGKSVILNGIDLSIEKGEIVGLLGPNGAGKTSLMRIIVGLVHPTEGEVRISGISLRSNPVEALRYVGAIIEKPAFYEYLSAMQNITLLAELHSCNNEDRIGKVIGDVGLTERASDKVRVYSLGMRQRLGLACALLTEPSLLVLDEPVTGLDPSGREGVLGLIEKLVVERNKTALIASHDVADVRSLCHKAIIMQKGVIAAIGTRTDDAAFDIKSITGVTLDPETKAILEGLS